MRAVAQRRLGHDGEAIGGAPRPHGAGRLESSANALGPGGVGTPDAVASQMADAMQEAGGDGFLLSMSDVSRRTVAEVADGLVPTLQARGLVRRAYAHEHFRDNLREF